MPDMTPPVRWEADRTPRPSAWPQPPLPVAMARGAAGRCPACGQSRLFDGFLRIAPGCPQCHAPLGDVPADDAPPYFTIFIVAHVVIGLMVLVEQVWAPALWIYAATFLPFTLLLTLLIMRLVKGATVGLMLRLGLQRDAADSVGAPDLFLGSVSRPLSRPGPGATAGVGRPRA